jgi:hypothetical protein
MTPILRRNRLEELLPPTDWRTVLAFSSGLLTFVATTGGLFIFAPYAQSAAVSGIVIGLVARKTRHAAAVGALVGLVGSLIGPANSFAALVPSLGGVPVIVRVATSFLFCGLVAGAVNVASRRAAFLRSGLLALGFALLIGNLWFTVGTMNGVQGVSSYGGEPLPAFNELLQGDMPPAISHIDRAMWVYVYQGVKAGRSFYPEYARVLGERRGGTRTVADFRTPTLFWAWSLLPDSRHIVSAFLLLASLSILSVLVTSSASVRMPFALPGAALLSSYLLRFPLDITLFSHEGWAGALGVLTLASFAASTHSRRWQAWTLLAVGAAVLAVLTREIMALVLVAGFASALVGDATQRRFRLVAWSVGIGVFAGLYLVHMSLAAPYHVASTGALQVPRAGQGSLTFALAALDYSTESLGSGGWWPLVFSGLGLLGIAKTSDPRLKVFAAIATLGTLASFLFLGNGAWVRGEEAAIIRLNYWGAAVVPLLYAIVPTAFAVVPAAKLQMKRELRTVAAGQHA